MGATSGALVEANKLPHKYACDGITAAWDITVSRLPVGRCELNPIQLMFTQVRGDVGKGSVGSFYNGSCNGSHEQWP